MQTRVPANVQHRIEQKRIANDILFKKSTCSKSETTYRNCVCGICMEFRSKFYLMFLLFCYQAWESSQFVHSFARARSNRMRCVWFDIVFDSMRGRRKKMKTNLKTDDQIYKANDDKKFLFLIYRFHKLKLQLKPQQQNYSGSYTHTDTHKCTKANVKANESNFTANAHIFYKVRIQIGIQKREREKKSERAWRNFS